MCADRAALVGVLHRNCGMITARRQKKGYWWPWISLTRPHLSKAQKALDRAEKGTTNESYISRIFPFQTGFVSLEPSVKIIALSKVQSSVYWKLYVYNHRIVSVHYALVCIHRVPTGLGGETDSIPSYILFLFPFSIVNYYRTCIDVVLWQEWLSKKAHTISNLNYCIQQFVQQILPVGKILGGIWLCVKWGKGSGKSKTGVFCLTICLGGKYLPTWDLKQLKMFQ